MSYIGERRGTENQRAEPETQSHTRVSEGDRSRSPTPQSATQGKIQTNVFSLSFSTH